METQIIGRVVADATVRDVKGGNKVTGFRVAINYRYRRNNETVKEAVFLDCSYWLNPGIAEYLTKGTAVQLSGRLGAQAWMNKENQPQATITFHVDRVELLGGGGAKPEEKAVALPVVATGGKDDDLPF